MRLITFILLLLAGASCADTKKIADSPNPLNGTWIPVQQEMGGKALPASFWEKQQLIINDSNYTVIAESVDKGVVKYTASDKMDIYGKEGANAGRHFTALYKYQNEQLTICYNLKGDAYPEAFDTKDKPLYFLSLFKRKQPK